MNEWTFAQYHKWKMRLIPNQWPATYYAISRIHMMPPSHLSLTFWLALLPYMHAYAHRHSWSTKLETTHFGNDANCYFLPLLAVGPPPREIFDDIFPLLRIWTLSDGKFRLRFCTLKLSSKMQTSINLFNTPNWIELNILLGPNIPHINHSIWSNVIERQSFETNRTVLFVPIVMYPIKAFHTQC